MASELPRRGLRREALVLLPVSLLLFAALACVTLFVYRAAIVRLVDERRSQALRQASQLAARAAAGATEEELARMLPAGSFLTLYDPRGALRWSSALVPAEDAPRPVPSPARFEAAAVEGPDEGADQIVAWAPYLASAASPAGEPRERWLLRFATPEPVLAAERRTLRILTPAVFGLSAAVAVLAIAFFTALNRPFEALLERARELPPSAVPVPDGRARGDEADFLLATFDRALAALRASDADPSGAARRDAEARLAESVAQLGELSAGVAHELRNSLGTLEGYLGLLARRDLPPAAREEVAEATREARALARVVDDFVAFARPGARIASAVDLVAVLERALADPSLADCDFRRDLPADRLEIRGDDRLLQRALRNLLLNAAQASSAASAAAAVEVALAADGNRARLTVRDRGAGIPPEIADRLFEPFASGRSGGAGLGLALARRIVLLHGGRLSLRNAAGGGAVAEVELPLVTSVTDGDSEAPPAG